jgi:glutathione synthase/RimK-type ligase-like ATP-grasp enzyme
VILVISYPGEEHTGAVVQRLERQGREVVEVDLGDFPARRDLVMCWERAEQPSFIVGGSNGHVDLKAAHVAWWRRVRPFQIDQSISDPTMRAFAESETSQAVNGMLDSLPCPWINPRAADEIAHRKPIQWSVARQAGLRMPRTLVTNQPEAARSFIAETGIGRTVFKPFLSVHEQWRETRVIEPADLEQLDAVRYAPVIFQEYVEGVDLRITIVGDEIFAAEIDARDTSYPYDMRMVVGQAAVQAIELPVSIQAALLELQQRLGLYYGAIDMRRTPQGEYYFFEVNPAGQWLFVEERTGLAISQAMADLLAGIEDRQMKMGKTS